MNESEQVVDLFREHYNIPLVHVDASEMFLGELAGVSDPERKRKIIGKLFIDVFEAEAKKSAAQTSWRKELCTQMSLKASVRLAVRLLRSRATTMLAGCPRE